LSLPVAGRFLRAAEWRLCDGVLSRFGGFWIAAIEKSSPLSALSSQPEPASS
jgi:hypothetical protein